MSGIPLRTHHTPPTHTYTHTTHTHTHTTHTHAHLCTGILHEDLRVFLEANVPSGKKAKKLVLGVADSKLGGAIQEGLGLKCEAGGTVAEVIRGVRLYFTKLVKGVYTIVNMCSQ